MSMNNGGPVIVFGDVSYKVGDATLIHDVSFEIANGETVVLLGHSGSGKTTILKLMNHLLIPSSGTVQVFGTDTLQWNPIELRRKIGYVIQEIGLFPHFTVRQNVGLVPKLERWDAGRIGSRVNEVLDLVGLDPAAFANRYPAELSGGQRQRVGVARALCADPPILLMDEPFGALDPVIRADLQTEFRRLQKQLSKTIVFVTHDVAEACIFGDRIGLMKGGKMELLLPNREFTGSNHPEVLAFLKPVRATLAAFSSK